MRSKKLLQGLKKYITSGKHSLPQESGVKNANFKIMRGTF